MGAWELIARYEDGDGEFDAIGLEEDQFDGDRLSVGINFYANENIRLGISYMDGEYEDITGAEFEGDELRARFQFAF